MPAAGVAHTANHLYERVGAAIAALPSDEFTAMDLKPTTGLDSRRLGTILSIKVRQGVLTKVGPARFRRTGLPFTRHASLGVIADAVFAVLATVPNRTPLSKNDITGEAESYLGSTEDLRSPVTSVLCVWTKSGVVERSGKPPRGYVYALREGITERPVCSSYVFGRH